MPEKMTLRQVVALDRLMMKWGINIHGAMMLLHLLDCNHVLVKDAIAAIGISHGAQMTRALNGLEMAGLIIREIAPEDRRSFLISITDLGRQAIGEIA